MAISLESYLDMHPMAVWNRDSWDERDTAIDTRLHQQDIFFGPLADYVQMPTGVGLNQQYYTGRELLQSHANHNPIGTYQRFTSGIYVDSREKSIRSRFTYGGKAQWDVNDEMVTRFSGDNDGLISAAMNGNLLNNYAEVHEKIARDALLRNARYKFLGDTTEWNASSANFSDLDLTNKHFFDIKFLEDMSFRMAVRSRDVKKAYGDYASPVPGENFRESCLVSVPTSVYYDLWNSPAKDWMVELRSAGDNRVINGGKVQYRNMTIQDHGVDRSLWNAGNVVLQATVTEPIHWGDGAPDPELGTKVGVYLTGQGGANVKHYIQCASGTNLALISAGDFINIHTQRTSEWGITNGCDVLDGMTITVEVLSVNDGADQIVVREPITEQYDSDLGGGVYAYITKAQHVYPVYCIGARGMMVWAGRQKPVWRTPTDEEADFPSIKRVTWQERGEMNEWQQDLHEIVFCAGSFANRGKPAIR